VDRLRPAWIPILYLLRHGLRPDCKTRTLDPVPAITRPATVSEWRWGTRAAAREAPTWPAECDIERGELIW